MSSIGGSPVAATFVFGPLDGTFIPVLMSLDHEHANLEMAARASVAAALEAVHPAPVEVDGHADDATYLAIIEHIPRRGRASSRLCSSTDRPGGRAVSTCVRAACRRTAWMLTGDAALDEDLLQTALARTWPHWDRVRTGQPEAYVRMVMVRTKETRIGELTIGR